MAARVQHFVTVGRPRWLDATLELTAVAAGIAGVAMPLATLQHLGAPTLLAVTGGAVLLGLAFTGKVYRFLRRPGLSRGELAVGGDGICLGDRAARHFIAFGDMTDVETDPIERRVIIGRRDGPALSFRVENPGEVADAIEAQRAAAAASEAASPFMALERGERDAASWGKRARTLLSVGLRDEAATPERLVALAEDPRAAPEQRLGAALALAEAPEPLRVRVRVAAESAARPHIREAMTEAVDGEIDVAALERALR